MSHDLCIEYFNELTAKIAPFLLMSSEIISAMYIKKNPHTLQTGHKINGIFQQWILCNLLRTAMIHCIRWTKLHYTLEVIVFSLQT